MTRASRSFWITGPGHGEVRQEVLAPPGPGEVLVETLVSGVSVGTERLVFAGRVPASQYEAMRAPCQRGHFPGPLAYGYAAVGRVVEGRAPVESDWVFCLHPHASAFVVPAAAVVPVPAAVPPMRAVLAANMETALNASWDAAVNPGERVAVIGAGVVGSLAAYVLARFGHRPLLVDIEPRRAALAAALGLDFCVSGDVRGPFDLVVHASGSPSGLVRALDLLAFEGRVLELSWYGDRPVTLPLGEAFHARRLTLQSSQVGTIARPLRGRIDHPERLRRALALLDDPRLDALLEVDLQLDDLPAFLADLTASGRSVLSARVHYS
ncbi:MAG: dehydrogenase [Geminicoccaceae bacterium]|nr:MAG: dehydrogenase [Geminicoccaceae bacterium]